MHRIDGAGHSNNTFIEGDPQVPTPATTVTDDWLNAVQEELANVIEEAGTQLDKIDNTQLATAVRTIAYGAWRNIEVFDTSGTWDVPADVTHVLVEAWGGGGGGLSAGPGAGGGGGGYAASIVPVTPLASITITVGAGGGIGASGGNSTFAADVFGFGGGGGGAGPGLGGAASGQITVVGGPGSDLDGVASLANGGDAGGPGGSGAHGIASGVKPGGGGGANNGGGQLVGLSGRIIVRW